MAPMYEPKLRRCNSWYQEGTSATMVDSGYPQFFRPLTLKRRRLIAACIRAFYARLYGSHADYRSILGREDLRDLFVQTIQSAALSAALPGKMATMDSRPVTLQTTKSWQAPSCASSSRTAGSKPRRIASDW